MVKLQVYRNIILYGNIFFMLVAIGILIFALLLVVDIPAVKQYTFNAPNAFYFAIGILGFAIFFISFFGVLGVIRKKKCVLLCYTGAAVVLLIFEIFAAVFFLLYTNNIATIPQLDSFVLNLQTEIELSLVALAETAPNDWKLTQDAIGCCGVDFEATYLYPQYNKTLSDFLESQLTGEGCETEFTNIIDIHANFTSFSELAEDALLAEIGDETYFCKDRVREFVRQGTVGLGAGAGVLFLFQVVTVFCCYVLFCAKPKDDNTGEVNDFHHESFSDAGQVIQNTLGRKKKKVFLDTGGEGGSSSMRPPPPPNTGFDSYPSPNGSTPPPPMDSFPQSKSSYSKVSAPSNIEF